MIYGQQAPLLSRRSKYNQTRPDVRPGIQLGPSNLCKVHIKEVLVIRVIKLMGGICSWQCGGAACSEAQRHSAKFYTLKNK